MTEAEKYKLWMKAIQGTEILRLPTSAIATFGPTNFSYYCLSQVTSSSTRIRKGFVRTQRPTIILPGQLRDIFEGFGSQSNELAHMLLDQLGEEKLRALGYQFHHEPRETELSSKALKSVLQNLKEELTNETLAAVVKGPDESWEISLIKLTLEVIAKSFPINVKDLEEKNLFDPEARLRNKVEALFLRAEREPRAISALAQFLQENKIFEDYQDRFFSLVKKTPNPKC